MFESISNSLKGVFNKLRFQDDEKALKRALDELKKILLKSDVHFKVVKELLKDIEKETKQNGIGKANFIKSLENNLTDILTAPGHYGFVFAKTPPTVVLMVGLQGSGKTTTTAKLANYLKQLKKKKVLIVAADLQRLAAVEQLKQLAQANELDLFFDDNDTNPIDIAKKGVEYAKEKMYDVVLIDTAGRLAIDEELMAELKAVKNVTHPDEIFYVADSLTGQDALRTAQKFDSELDITGVILTKFDGDSKGGIALSIAHQVKKPLRFIGTGEKIPDLEVFVPDRITSRILGAGDIESLVEKTNALIDEKEAKKISKKIKKGQFNFEDFLNQLETLKKMGSMKSLLSMIPGMSQFSKQLKDMDFENSSDIKKIKAMINSMTPKERQNPDLLKVNSRKRRIAKGAGLEIQDVNRILKQFQNAAKLAKKFANKKGMPNMNDLLKQLGNMKLPK
ncbi:MAG: signal recognition particle protein [Epsilonproteobacteria bacterium]|nr:signal recognition particle protein [Campylobacterota bacterium]